MYNCQRQDYSLRLKQSQYIHSFGITHIYIRSGLLIEFVAFDSYQY